MPTTKPRSRRTWSLSAVAAVAMLVAADCLCSASAAALVPPARSTTPPHAEHAGLARSPWSSWLGRPSLMVVTGIVAIAVGVSMALERSPNEQV